MLDLSDYPHLRQSTDLAASIIEDAKVTGRGVDIVLVGPYGTGKTQLARALAEHCGLRLLEVSRESARKGEERNRSDRLKDLMALVNMVKGRSDRSILIDECEDLLSTKGDSKEGRIGKFTITTLTDPDDPQGKQSINIWVCNSLEEAERAFSRRANLFIEVDIAPPEQRLGTIKKYAREFELALNEKEMRRLSRYRVSPASYKMAIMGAASKEGATVEDVIFILKSNVPHYQSNWEPVGSIPDDFVCNTSLFSFGTVKPTWVEARLQAEQLTRAAPCFVLWGPAGSGKTTLARDLAERHFNDTHEENIKALVQTESESATKKVQSLIDQAKSSRCLCVLNCTLVESHLMKDTIDLLIEKAATERVPLLIAIEADKEDFPLIPSFAGAHFRSALHPLDSAGVAAAYKHFTGVDLDFSAAEKNRYTIGDVKHVVEALQFLGIEKAGSDAIIKMLEEGRQEKKRGIGFTANLRLDNQPPAPG